MTKLFPVLVASALLLAGCGKPPVGAPVAGTANARAAAPAARSAGAIPAGKHLVLTRAASRIEKNDDLGQRQVFTLAGRLDGAAFSFETATFFPYYVPMFGSAEVNGKAVKLTPAGARAMLALLDGADLSAVDGAALHNLRYGLDFLGRRDAAEAAAETR